MRNPVISVACALLAVTSVGATTACRSVNTKSSGSYPSRLPVQFVPAGPKVMGTCRDAARTLGYAVTCPTQIPRGLLGTRIGIPSRTARGLTWRWQRGCQPRFPIVGLSPCRPVPRGWKGWIFGSSELELPREHLVIRGSPRPVRAYAKALDGPASYPGELVEPGAWVTVNGWRARWVVVPSRTESIFSGHVVLVWTTGGHTYSVGFHDWNRRAVTRAMDLELVRHIRMVAP